MSEKWATSLEDNAGKLRNLAKFYQDHGLFIIATLLGAATDAINDEVSKVRSNQRKEIRNVRRIGESAN